MLKCSTLKTMMILAVITVSNVFGQGLSRSTGVGVRLGFWEQKKDSRIVTQAGDVVASGAGSVYFFSRLYNRWFLETSIGGVAEAQISALEETVRSTSVVPFLFGARFDVLPSHIGSVYQPYIAGGAGSYWIVDSYVGPSVVTETNVKMGPYIGGGLNVIFKSWFAMNADVKYHFVNLKNTVAENYSGTDISIGFSFMWGSKIEIFRIEDVKLIVKDIYPAYYQFYNSYPLALVAVKNTADYLIEVKVKSNINGYSERSNESSYIKIDPGETEDVPISAIFGEKLLYSDAREPAVIDIEVEARAGATHTKSKSINIVIHNRKSWNGEIDRLQYFITPDNDKIMEISRRVMDEMPDISNEKTRNLKAAEAVFADLTKTGIRYQSDPNIPYYKDDYVQFAAETMEKRSGDCDDLVVLYSSLLESIGIQTAFVDVQDPQKEVGHLYLMLDTGIDPAEGELISSNEKKYIIRKQRSGKASIWIPVETTLTAKSFEEAWKTAALSYLQEGVIRGGLTDGWVKIVNVN